MKNSKTLTIVVLTLSLMVCQARVSGAEPMGTAFTYQGRLIDNSSPTDGLYDFRFSLFDESSDEGNQVGIDLQLSEVDVNDGYFTVELDFADPNIFTGDARWLQIAVRPGELEDPAEYTTLTPRQKITPTPYALYAKNADELAVLIASLQARIEALENPPGWSMAEPIEMSLGLAENPQVAVDSDGNAVAVWQQYDGINYYNIWSNRYVAGNDWCMAEMIETENVGNAEDPQVAVDAAGNAVAVWQQHDGINHYNIWSNRYVPGTGWATAELIEKDDTGDASSPQVAVDPGGNAVAVWQQYDGHLWNIWSNRYVAGTGWATAELIETDKTGDAYRPQVAVDPGGNAVVVWQQYDTRWNIWSNRYVAGTGWGAAELIETNNVGPAEYPQVAVDAVGNAVAVWQQWDVAHCGIWANRYVAVTGWQTPELIDREDAGNTAKPQVAVHPDGKAVAVWSQNDGIFSSIWSNHYVEKIGWAKAELIESKPGGAGSPQVAIDASENAVVVWQQWDGVSYNIWANRYAAGTGWAIPEIIETDPGPAAASQIGMDVSGNAIAVWSQHDGTTSNIWSNRYE